MRYESEIELRAAIEKQLKGKLSDMIWNEYRPDWGPAYDDADVEEIIAELQLAGVSSSPEVKEVPNPAIVRSEIRARELLPWIRNDRKSLFGNPEPPFKNLSETEDWLRAEAEGQDPEKDFIGTLPFVNSDNWTGRVPVRKGSILQRLRDIVTIRAREFGCKEAQATVFILTGEVPYVPPIAHSCMVTKNRSGTSTGGELTITIREPISTQRLVDYYRRLRQVIWGKERDSRPIEERDAEIVQFVLKNRHRLRRKSWYIIMKEWNKEYPDWAFDYEDHFRTTFKRAYMKIYPGVKVEGLPGKK
jgi:hypothetical protein